MKKAAAMSVIGGADGPTSSFILGGKRKKSFRQIMRKLIYNFRKSAAVKSIKADPHSMDEVNQYIVDICGFTELNTNHEEYQSEYNQLRTSFLLMYAPQLLGNLESRPGLEGRDEASVKKFQKQMELRQAAAKNISKELFDIDLHIFDKNETDSQMRIIVETKYGHIGSSSSAPSKQSMKKNSKIIGDVYRYYGVTQEDIDKKTERYENLIRVLARG